jgi:hypothetical protein
MAGIAAAAGEPDPFDRVLTRIIGGLLGPDT